MKAIFLDRDGTINEDTQYLQNESDIKIIDGVPEALHIFKDNGFLNIVVTNQSAIARGLLGLEDLENIHNRFKSLLTLDNRSLIDDIFYSPYHPDGIINEYSIRHNDTKPGIGMLLKAREKYLLNFDECYIIGDSLRDLECGINAGIKPILVLTGVGLLTQELVRENNIKIEYIACDLLDASRYISEKLKK